MSKLVRGATTSSFSSVLVIFVDGKYSDTGYHRYLSQSARASADLAGRACGSMGAAGSGVSAGVVYVYECGNEF